MAFAVGIAKAETLRLTSNNSDDYSQQVDSGKVAWIGFDGHDYEIYLYDIVTATTTQITNDNFNTDFFDIAEGKIAWKGGSNVFLYDIATGSSIQLANNAVDSDSGPQISEGKVVWLGRIGTINKFFIYDIIYDTTTEASDNTKYTDINFKFNKGTITWQGSVNFSKPEIFIYDIASGLKKQLTNNDYFDTNPVLDDRKIVWEIFGHTQTTSGHDLVIYDLDSDITTQITNSERDDTNAQIKNGRVAWVDGSSGVFLYDIASGTTTQIGGQHAIHVNIDEGRIVWDGLDGNDFEIFVYDIYAQSTFQVTKNNYNDVDPYIKAGKIAWRGSPGGNSDEIFLSDGSAVVNTAPVLSTIGNKTIEEGQTLQFTVSATDPDFDNLSFSASNLPPGASFNSQTHKFSWTPAFSQSGNYSNIEFTVTDDGNPIELDTELITISVGNVNRPPVIDHIGTKEVLENQQFSFGVSATDPDEDGITLSAESLPTGSSFNSQTGVFSWTPTFSQAGIYIVKFYATGDGSPTRIGSIEVAITVGDVPTPIEQAETINTVVVNYNLTTNVENSYLSNLKKVSIFIENGQIQAAINQLNAFIGKVNNDYTSGKITQAIHDNLVSLAQTLISDLQ